MLYNAIHIVLSAKKETIADFIWYDKHGLGIWPSSREADAKNNYIIETHEYLSNGA